MEEPLAMALSMAKEAWALIETRAEILNLVTLRAWQGHIAKQTLATVPVKIPTQGPGPTLVWIIMAVETSGKLQYLFVDL